jgi:signal recognition particle subunit SRP9
MLVEDWDAFAAQAEALYRADPLKFRYVLKYRRGKLEAKCTDDRTCLQFRTDQQALLKKIEALNSMFFALMATGSYDAEAAAQQAAAAAAQQQQQAQAQQQQQQQQQRGGTRRRG